MCREDGFASGWERLLRSLPVASTFAHQSSAFKGFASGFRQDFKATLEEQLSDAERDRLTELLGRADEALETPREPEWWLAP